MQELENKAIQNQTSNTVHTFYDKKLIMETI